MIQKIVISFVISFVIKQLEKFGDKVNWAKVKHDAELRVRALMPGNWFDDEAAYVVNLVLAGVQDLCEEGDQLKKILKLVAGKKYAEAVALVKELLLALWAEHKAPEVETLKLALIEPVGAPLC